MSPSGAEQFQKQADVISARRSATSDAPRPDYFQIQDGQSARVRFLEQGDDICWAQTHRIKNRWGYFDDIVCLDQYDNGTPCPMCSSDNVDTRKRSTKGYINIIWRGTAEEVDAEGNAYARAPIYKRNEKGQIQKDANKQKIIVGFEDSVWLWKCSKTILAMIFKKDQVYKGIMSRDFVIARTGSGMEDTSYTIEPAVVDGGPEAMTVADNALAGTKNDVVALSTPESFEYVQGLVTGQQIAPGGTFNRDPSPAQGEDVFAGGTPGVRSSAFQR